MLFKNLNNTQYHFVIKTAILVTLFLFVFVGLFVTHIHRTDAINGFQYTEKMKDNASNSKYQSEQNTRNKVFSKSAQSSDPILKGLGQNRVNYNVSIPTIKQFFNGYYNWTTLKGYQNRSRKCNGTATNNILRNKRLFNNDLAKIVQKNNLSAVLNNVYEGVISQHGNNINLLLDCDVTTWLNNTNNNQTDHRESGTQWWTATFNSKTQKITSISPIYANPTANNNNNSSTTAANTAGDGVQY